MLAPNKLNIPRPNASNVRNSLIRFFKKWYSKRILIPVIDVIITYDGSIMATGGVCPNTTSLIIPPASPAVPDSTITPTISSLCSIAFIPPVIANIKVPKRSKT
jgi:hypothetical protein